MPKLATFGTRLKVLIMVFLAFKTLDLVKKVASFFWHEMESPNNALKSLKMHYLDFRSSAKIGTGKFDH